jgi:tRNA pseudouridine38-40 synthase
VPESFHARHDALCKTYRYTVNTRRFPDVFRRRYQFHHPRPLDVAAMREGLRHLVGEHDFTSFASPHSAAAHHVRTIFAAQLAEEREGGEAGEAGEAGVLHFELTGNGFLYNMVRIIAGTLLEVGEGKREPREIARILAARDRNLAGPTAPAHGLTRMEVGYDARWGLPWNRPLKGW